VLGSHQVASTGYPDASPGDSGAVKPFLLSNRIKWGPRVGGLLGAAFGCGTIWSAVVLAEEWPLTARLLTAAAGSLFLASGYFSLAYKLVWASDQGLQVKDLFGRRFEVDYAQISRVKRNLFINLGPLATITVYYRTGAGRIGKFWFLARRVHSFFPPFPHPDDVWLKETVERAKRGEVPKSPPDL